MPSQFSHEILNANPYAFLDDAPLEERRARASKCAASCPLRCSEKLGGSIPRPSPKCAMTPGLMCVTPKNCTTRLLTLIALPARTKADAHITNRLRAKFEESLPAWSAFFDQLRADTARGRPK